MDVAVIYESLFGNTRTVAEAIANGFRSSRPDANVTLREVNEAPPGEIGAVDVLIVGGPTHVRHMATDRTRRIGLRYWGSWPEPDHGAEGSARQGVREWLDNLPAVPPGRRAAAFDTRFGSRLAGGAARSIFRDLQDHGYEMVTGPEGFIVGNGPAALEPGEEDRARSWGATLARRCSTAWLDGTSGKAEK